MLILGITTSTMQVGCAIGGHEGVLAQVHSSRGKRHAESLTPSIDFLRRQARVDLDEIGCVAVDLGPGLFTGLRVGIAAAKAMAHALRVPMIGVASLDLVAFPVRWSSRLVVAAIDARRGELFTASYRQVPGGHPAPHRVPVASPDDLAGDLEATGEEVLLVGDGALRYREAFADLGPGRAGRPGPGPPLGRLAGAARARPGAARGLRAAVGARAALPPPSRRRDQLGHPRRPGAGSAAGRGRGGGVATGRRGQRVT